MSQSLYSQIERGFPADRDRPVIERADGRLVTWREMADQTARFARLLAGLGLEPGDRVAVRAEKSPEALMLYLATLRAGLVYLPMNTAYRREEVDFLVGNAEPRAIICDPALEAEAADIGARHGSPYVLSLDAEGGGSFRDEAEGLSPDFMTVPRNEDALAAIIYTSGTTGRPKGAMLTHRNLVANARDLVDIWGFTADDVLLHALPLFHVHGLFVASHCVLFSGARMVFLPRFEAAEIIARLPRCSVLMGVPTFYTRLLADPAFGPAVCADMRLFVSGSAPLLPETFVAFQERTGHTILERYGMTETGMITSNPLTGERRAGTVGIPLPGVTVRVAGSDDLALPRGEVGGVQVHGDNVFTGYWRLPEKTAEEFTEDGWFRTGDIGRIDDDGYLHLVGRAKDLIITGGYNVYPIEVEQAIDEMAGVGESAVIGLPDPDFGEAVTAVVTRRGDGEEEAPDAEAVIAHLRQHLANYKVPKTVIFVEELPRNTMGKVQKALLRDTYGRRGGKADG
ncbi:MAG: AMP-binding protein [Alphaproteobacteria bacterium]|jgi:malonyl-CoA/methylmalonyl-CoA synthetase|nr:AMP-binding protein [Alphaproteobacteria bacterium]